MIGVALASSGCKTPPYDWNDSVDGLPDLSLIQDFSHPDLRRPHYCDGIFVFDEQSRLSFFDPVKLEFHDVVDLACPAAGGALPFSMALSRAGTAWMEYDSGQLFKVDSETGACTATTFQNTLNGLGTFGMGFAADAPGSASETLYIAGTDTGELAEIDQQTLAITSIGQLPSNDAELTGTGSGELWAFLSGAISHAGKVDKMTAQVSPNFPLPQLGDTSQDGFAFGYFGGAFYIFLLPPNGTTNVYEMNAANGAVRTLLTNTGRHVVGAGVSTCAPQN